MVSLNKNINFYWEDLEEKYIIDRNKKYVIYFKGCFSPPTLGHINAIKKIIKDFGNDVKIIINQLGPKNKHNVDKEINQYILYKYIKTIFPNNNIAILFRGNNNNLINHPYLIGINYFVIVKGNEKNINVENKKDIELIICNKIISYINLANMFEAKIIFIMHYRPFELISTSRFIENLIQYKYKLINNEPIEDNIEQILKFIPQEICIKDAVKIINKLIACNLKK